MDNYNFLLLAIQGSANPGIYRLDGNGAGLANIFPDVDDFDYDPRSGLIVFTRRIFVEQPTLAPSPTREPVTAAPTSNSPVSTQTSGGGLVIQGNSAGLPDIEQYQMFITNINSTDEVTEVTSSSLPSAFAPAISPDGRYIAFTTNIDGNAEIYLYNVGTGLSSRVTDNAVATDIDPDWLPVGSALIFSSDRVSAGNNDLFTIDPFASDPEATVERVVEGRGRNILPQWSPRGTLIAYLNINSDETTVRLASPDGSSVRDITFNPDWDYSNPSWTPDGNYVIYSSGPPNSPLELRVYSPTTRTEQTIRTINLSVLGVMPR